MTQPVANIVNTVATAGTSTNVFITYFATRSPTNTDTYFPVSKRWVDVSTGKEYILSSLYVEGGTTYATWINLTNGTLSAVDTLSGNSGTNPVTPDGSANINVRGDSTSINISGDGVHTLTANVVLPSQYYTLSSDVSSIHGISTGTSGQVLTSNGVGAQPTYQTIPDITVPSQYDTVVSTGSALQGVSPGTSGQVLTSNGASAYPTYQNVSGPSVIWSEVSTNFTAEVGHGYQVNLGSTDIIATLPGGAALGDTIYFICAGNPAGHTLTIQIPSNVVSAYVQIGIHKAFSTVVNTSAGDSITLVSDGGAICDWLTLNAPQGVWILT